MFAMGFASMHEMESLKPSSVPALSVLLGGVSGWVPMLLQCLFHSYTSAWCEIEGAARFRLSHWLILTEVDCAKCEGKRLVLRAGWGAWGCVLFQEEQDILCKNLPREWGKCFLPNELPSCAHLCIPPSGQSSLY